MKGLLFLLCCIEILGSLLCGAESRGATPVPASSSPDPRTTPNRNATSNSVPSTASVSTPPTPSESMSTQSAKTVSRSSKSPPGPPTSGPKPTSFYDKFLKRECLPLVMVAGGLLIACTILLLSTFLLLCKVCRLSGRIKVLTSNADLTSNSESWIGTAKEDKSKPGEEPKETTVLMADVNQAQEEVGNGATKEEGDKVNADEQTEEEKKEEEEGDAAKTEEASTAPVAAADNSSPSKQQEEAADSQPDEAAAASTSEGTEEAKDVV